MKAQFWSFDIIFAIIIFVFAVVILTVAWLNISGQFSIANSGNIARMQQQLQELSVSLLSQGSPPNWNLVVDPSSPASWENISIGLGNGTTGTLSQSKIDELSLVSNTNYQAVKPALGIAYDYYLTFNSPGYSVSIGKPPTNSVTTVTSVQTATVPSTLNGNAIQIQMELWSNSTLGIE